MKLLSVVALSVLAITSSAHAIVTTEWQEYSSNPVYSPGKAYYPTILKEGAVYRMWSDSATGVQMATSTDGINWANVGNVTGLTTPKHTLVEKIGSNYQMWYWPNLAYSIGDIRTAISTDGLTWTDDKPITQVGNSVIYNSGTRWNRGSYGAADVLYNPGGSATIVEPVDKASVWANKFVMYYDGTTGGAESLGLAVSNDGVNWQGYMGGDSPVFQGAGSGWDTNYVSRATVISESSNAYHMWYSGGTGSMQDGIGYAFSTDGISWSRDVSNPIFHKTDSGAAWRNDRTYTPMVIGNEMWFTGRSSTGAYTVGYAIGVPEPGAIVLLITAGLGALAYALRRRRS